MEKLVFKDRNHLWPAISLAYEVPETDIMQRPPRNPEYDRLVNIRLDDQYFRLILFSYLQVGVFQMYAGFVTYFEGMFQTYAARKGLEASCHSGYFFAVVALQWSDALISKTRKNSIVMQGTE
ncbi:hypothetical protein COOONC_25977 [Cooperia oncophora]